MTRSHRSVLCVFISLLLAAPLLASELTVSGVVQDSAGRPFPGAQVALLPVLSNLDAYRLLLAGRREPEPLAAATTGAAGRFALAVPSTGVFEVAVRAEGYLGIHYSPLPVAQPMELPPAELRPAVAAAFEVVGPAGEPQTGWWVYAVSAQPLADWKSDGWKPASRFGRTDASGRITLPRLTEERLSLILFEPASAVFHEERALAGGRLRVQPVTGSTVLEARQADGSPAPRVLVAAGPLAWPAGETGEDGRLVLRGRPAERTPVQLLAPDGQRHLAWLAAGATRTEVVLADRTRVSGRAVEAQIDRPLAGVLVWPGHDPGSFAITAQDGRFTLAMPPEESWWIQLEAPGFQALAARGTPAAVAAAGQDPRLALTRAGSCRGRVTAPDGRPVPGASLVATPLPGAPPLPSFRADGAEARTVSDPAGHFDLAGLRPGISYAIEIRAAGWAPKRLPGARLRDGATADLISDLGAIVLAPEAWIEGRIVDRDGKAIPGAKVRRDGAAPVLSDARGRFTLGELGRGDEVDLRVEHPSFLPADLPGVAAPTASPLEIVLQPAAQVAGWIVDESGQGIAEAAVTLRAPDIAPGVAEPRPIQEERSTASDRDGRFELDAVTPGLYEVSVHAEGFQPQPDLRLQVSVTSPPEELRVALARGAALEGRVLTSEEEPVAGARVSVASAAGVSDELGRYRLDGVPPGRQTVKAYQPTFGQLARTAQIAAGDNHLDLVFEPGQRVSGRVIDDAGEPVAGAAVRLVGGSLPGETLTKSGPQGGFVFPHVLKGRYRVQAARGSFAPLSDGTAVVIADAPVEDLKLVLARGATLTGRIRGLAADELAAVDVTAERRQGGSASAGVESAGTFEISDLAPGTWHVRATLQNGAREASGTVEIPPGARTATLDLEFRRGLTLAGRVLYSGAPLAGASVTVTGHGHASRSTGTSYEGRFRLLDLEPGWYRVEVTHPAELLTEIQDLQLARDEDLTIDITTAQVSGHVVSGDEPLADATVVMQRLLSAGDGGLLAVGTDSRGSFRLARVTAGRYRLTIRKPGYAPLMQELEVQAGIELGALDLGPAP